MQNLIFVINNRQLMILTNLTKQKTHKYAYRHKTKQRHIQKHINYISFDHILRQHEICDNY